MDRNMSGMVILWIIRVKFIGSGRSKMKDVERIGTLITQKKKVRIGKEIFLRLKLPFIRGYAGAVIIKNESV